MSTTTASPNVHDFWAHYKSLEKLSDSTTSDMKVLLTLFSNIKKAFEHFSGTLRILGENFHKEISKHYHTDERNFSYYHFLGNYLLKVSEMNKNVGKNLEHMILTPYLDFAQQLDTSNRNSIENLYKLLINLDSSKNTQKKTQDTYYKLSRTAEKIQDSFGKMIDEGKTEDIILKAQDKMIKIKMEAQESGQIYRNQLNTTNQLWKKLYAEYKPAFKVYDENEDSKAYYNRNIIMRLVKRLEDFYSKPEEQSEDNLEEKFMELDEKSVTKADTFQVLTLGKLDDTLQAQPEEEFVSYEAKRKMDEANVLKALEEDEYTIISGGAEETNKQFIHDYARVYQPKRANLSLSASVASTTDQNESVASEDSALKEQKESQEIPASPDVVSKGVDREEKHKKMLTLLGNAPSRKVLIDSLVKQRDPVKDNFEIKLSPKVYDQLQDLLVKVLKELIKDNDYETLAQYLPLINKYYTYREGQNFFIYRFLKTKTLWEDPLLWSSILRCLYEKKTNDESQKQKKYQEIEKSYTQPKLMNQLWSLGKTISAALDVSKKNSVTDSEIYTSVLHEIAFYLSHLTKNLLVSSEILMRLALEVGIEKEDISDLILVQKREFDVIVRERIKFYPYTKNKKAQNKWNTFYPIHLALDYLEPKDLVNLLSLSKQTRSLFKKKVYRTIFYNYSEQLTQPQRFQIWWNILEVDEMKLNYKELTKEFKEISNDKSLRSVEEVIQIDVARSFNKHSNCDSKLLQQLLESYAAYDQETSYCQGMNYMMGFLYINTQDPDRSFKAFVKIMDKFLKGLFDNEFKLLKLFFFKFTRVLELYAPDLAQHFKKEKVEPSFFIPSWFITVFSNAFQYSTKSQFLEKIWDFFLLDGIKIIFKSALLILVFYKKDLLEMRFDKILHFLSDLGKEELFKNEVYWKVRNGEIPVAEAPREYSFIKNFEKSMKNTHLTKQLLKTFDADHDVLETRMGRLLNLSKKK